MDDELKEMLAKIMARLDALEGKADEKVEVIEDEEADETKDADVEEPAKDADTEEAKDEEDDTPPASMDAALKQIAGLKGRLAAVESRPAMDEATVVKTLAARNSLVERLTKHVGTFDHASMTTIAAVAAYGVGKLGIKGVAKGSEVVALDAYLQAKPDPTKAPSSVAEDKKPSALAGRIANHGKTE